MAVERPTNARWIVLAVVILASASAYFLRANLSIVGGTMIGELGLTETHLGYMFSAFAAGYAIFQLPGGVLGNRFGPRRIFTVLIVAWAILTLLTALIPSADTLSVGVVVVSLIVLRFLVGTTQAPLFPVTAGGVIANWFPVGGWGLPFGLQIAGYTLGAAACAPLLVWLMDSYGWRFAMLLSAPPALCLAAFWWWYIRDFPRDHRGVNPQELSLINSGRSADSDESVAGAWKLTLANRDILLLTISYFCTQYVFYLFFSWFFFYLVEVREFEQQLAGIFTSAQWILGAIAGLAGGILTDVMTRKWGVRLGPRWLAVSSLLLCGVTLIIGAVSDNATVVVVMLCVSFASTQIADNPYWIATMAVAERHAQVATGVLNTGGNVVGFFGGMLVPLIAGIFGWTAAMASGAAFAFVAAGIWFFIRADRPMIERESLQ
jgi:MFS transporter, ACS family, glucarate transporter